MDWGEAAFLMAFCVTLLVLGSAGMFWLMKKAGIQPMRYYKKLFYDNVTSSRDSRTGNHRTYWKSKKGGKLSLEIEQTRGTMTLEFYTESGRVLQRWQTGDPKGLTVELPAGEKVFQRMEMNHFSGSVSFLKNR
ncbi:MAG: hypothetical protein HFF83_09895 [Oscillibacter sp.]|jgi:hypothetical protein|nr:hypothetical protein [Oscillibacter sp.]